jgi:hypothetical protein
MKPIKREIEQVKDQTCDRVGDRAWVQARGQVWWRVDDQVEIKVLDQVWYMLYETA